AFALASCSTYDVRAADRADARRLAADAGRRAGLPVVDAVEPSESTGMSSQAKAILARPLSDESAVKVALLENPAVRESYENLGIARAELIQAGLLSNPVFRANAKFFTSGTEVELGLAQSFLDVFFVPMRRCVAAADQEAAEAAVERDLVRLVYD